MLTNRRITLVLFPTKYFFSRFNFIGKSWKTHPEIFLKISFSRSSHKPFYRKNYRANKNDIPSPFMTIPLKLFWVWKFSLVSFFFSLFFWFFLYFWTLIELLIFEFKLSHVVILLTNQIRDDSLVHMSMSNFIKNVNKKMLTFFRKEKIFSLKILSWLGISFSYTLTPVN